MTEKVESVRMGVETDSDKNFRHSLASLGVRMHGQAYDREVSPLNTLILCEERLKRIRAKYVPATGTADAS